LIRALLDTNIVVDVATNRAPWATDSIQVLQANANKQVKACITSTAVTDLFYICRKLAGQKTAYDTVRLCLENLEVLNVTSSDLSQALQLPGLDFEDNVQIACSLSNQIEIIVTRDKDGFKDAAVEALTPTELIVRINSSQKTP
jgi:predicted nucleic acid-binding protein